MNKNIILLHFTVLFISVPALFAKGIDIPADQLIWWRCLFGTGIAFTILTFIKKLKVDIKQLKWLAVTGVIMGLHWWSYFLSIKLSTVGIGILALFTYPVISVFLEPLFFKGKIHLSQILGALGIVIGVFILVPEYSFKNTTTLGIVIGVCSAFFYALRDILTRKHLTDVPAITTMGYHILFAFITISFTLFYWINEFSVPTAKEAGLILVLASFFTLGSHGLLVYCFKFFTVTSVSIVNGLQVVYGSVLAFILFNEVPGIRFFIGAFIILGVSLFETLQQRKRNAIQSN